MPVVLGNMTRSLVTGTKVRVMKPSSGNWSTALGDWITTVNFYDNNRRVIQTQSTNHRGGTDVTTIQYNFQGKKLAEVLRTENPVATDDRHKVTTIRKWYQYDNAGRLANTYHRINNGPERNLYTTIYDAFGRPESKNPISSNDVASQDYDYNIRGWLSGINRSWVEGQGNDRFFGEVLSYNNVNLIYGCIPRKSTFTPKNPLPAKNTASFPSREAAFPKPRPHPFLQNNSAV